MLLAGKRVVVHGAGGSLGSALARVLAGEGATVFLAGRTLSAVQKVAAGIVERGGEAVAAEVDAMDESAITAHAEGVGPIDVSINAVGAPAVQGIPLLDLAADDFMTAVDGCVRTVFLTSRAAARQMVRTGTGGTILTLSASPARLPGPLMGGFGVACGAIETLTRHLAGEWAQHGIRVVCLRPNKIGDQGDITPEFQADLESATLLGRLPTRSQVAHFAAFLASDHASPVTGAIVNMTAGAVVD